MLSLRLPDGIRVEELPALGGPPQPQGAEWQIQTAGPTTDLHHLTGWVLAP